MIFFPEGCILRKKGTWGITAGVMLDGGEHKMSRRGGETVANKYTSARAPLWEEVCKNTGV